MPTNKIIFTILLLGLSKTYGQALSNTLSEADDFFNNNNYALALPKYLELIQAKKSNADIDYKTAICYLQSRSQKHKAAPFLEKVVDFANHPLAEKRNREKTLPTGIYNLLGDAYYHNHKFDQAITAYEKHKAENHQGKNINQPVIEAMNTKIEICRLGKELQETFSQPFELNQAKLREASDAKKGKSPFGEYATTLLSDNATVVLSFTVPIKENMIVDRQNKFFEPLTQPLKPDTAVKKTLALQNKAPQSDRDTVFYSTTIGTSVDGQIILTYKNEGGNANLYISRLKKDNWSEPEQLDKSVNPRGWETHEHLSADGNEMYFASNRPGGYGGMDIYRCQRLPNGDWSKAKNLGSTINGPADEEGPYIFADGKTLFFSSNRNKPACYEIFSSTLNDDDTWSPLENVGYPLSRNNDNFYQVTSEKNKLYATAAAIPKKTTKRSRDSLDKNRDEDKDNFLLTVVNPGKGPLTVLKGEVLDFAGTNPLEAQITVCDNESESIEGIYHSNKHTGSYAFILPTEKNNNIVFEAKGYLFYSTNLSIHQNKSYYEKIGELRLQPLIAGSKTELNNVFFEGNQTVPSEKSNIELEMIVRMMRNHPQMKLQIINYIYSRKNKKQNKKISKARALSVISYLTNKGINAGNLQWKAYRKSKNKQNRNKKSSEFGIFHLEPEQKMELKIIAM
jgi:outer membrane protein OmpA-like peptidoglycan-associated protein